MAEEKYKRGENFDIFISYRRSDGKDIARILNLAFKNAGYRCFLDYNDLEGGVFGKKLESAVLDAPVFAMVLTPDYFARCNQEGDWVRKEIDLALENHKIIVPINYDNVLNGVPDYLDKDFQDRIGCHNFATVYSNDSFEPTFNNVVEVRIRKVMGDLPKQTDKAQVTVVADADCTLLKNNEVIATLQADEDNYILLGEGNHLLKAQSDEFSDISTRITKSIPKVPWEDFIEIQLADKVQARRNEILEKEKAEKEAEKARIAAEKAEAERIQREKEEQERRLKEEQAKNQIEQAVRKLVLNPTAHPKTLTGHDSGVYSVAASPDGKYLASDSGNETLIIWDAKSGAKLKTLEGHSDCVNSVRWSPDGKYLASGVGNIFFPLSKGELVIWDAKSGEKLQTLKGHSDSVRSVCWSPDGRYLASGSHDQTLIIWDAKSGQKLKTLESHSDYVYSVCWSPDGRYLASGSDDKTIIIWDAYSGQRLKTLKGHSKSVFSVCWSPDGKYLASGSEDSTLIIWDANSGQRLKSLEGHSDTVWSVCWSPDGKYLASGTGHELCIRNRGGLFIWDAKSGECIRTLEGHFDTVFSVCWSPDGKYLASGSRDKTIKIWGVE